MNEVEEVTDPTIDQGLLNSCRGIASTKLFVAYMRMGYTFIASCRMRVQGHNGIEAVVAHLCQAGDVQLDLELAQIQTFQLDRLSSNGKEFIRVVVTESFKFFTCLDKFLVHISERRYLRFGSSKRPLNPLCQARQITKRSFDVSCGLCCCCVPDTNSADIQFSLVALQTNQIICQYLHLLVKFSIAMDFQFLKLLSNCLSNLNKLLV